MWWRIGAVLGALGVALGAFGAHGLKQLTTEQRLLDVWDTGAKYHLIHALAILLVALHPARPQVPGWLFTAGIVVFSGSLYMLALTGKGWFGAITPIGGVCFIAGWIALALAKP
jgi:uncharacterized membrane protein YgdD (TMEM256/DUF423 family)